MSGVFNYTLALENARNFVDWIYHSERFNKLAYLSSSVMNALKDKINEGVSSDLGKTIITSSAPAVDALKNLKNRVVSPETVNRLTSSPYTFPVVTILALGTAILILATCCRRQPPPSFSEFYEACRNNEPEKIKRFLRRGVDPNADSEKYPLHLLSGEGSFEAVESMLRYGADPKKKDERGRIPLHSACLANLKTVQALMARSDKDAQDESLNTPLHLACLAGKLDTVRFLIRSGVNCRVASREGSTPLHMACGSSAKAEIVSLIQDKSDVAALDQAGETAFYRVCAFCKDPQEKNKIVRLLLPKMSKGRINSIVKEWTALDWIKEESEKELYDLLVAHGAKKARDLN